MAIPSTRAELVLEVHESNAADHNDDKSAHACSSAAFTLCSLVFLCFPSACCVSGVLFECPVPVVSVLIRSFDFDLALSQCAQ
jgi:hypothetical protein